MANKGNPILPLPAPSRGALVKSEADRTGFALLEFQSPTAALIAEPAPFMGRLILYAITTMILAMVASMWFVKVDMVVVAQAVTQSVMPNIIIQPLETAVVRSIDVKEGQTVKKGQLLATLDPTLTGSDDKSTTAQAQSLRAQVNRLRAEMEDREYVSDGTKYSDAQAQMWEQRHANFVAQRDSLMQKIQSARYRVQQLQADVKGFEERLPLAQTVENKRRTLANVGLDSQLNLLQAMDYRAQMQASLEDSRQQLTGAQHDLQGAIADLAAFVHQWYSDTSNTLDTQERALSDMAGQATKNQFLHKLVEMRAPEDAVVYSISNFAIGSVLQSGSEMMRLVPTNSALQVVGMIQGSDAGYMKVGDPVAIKFDTLPYIIYGIAEGRVTNVSADSFANMPAPQLSPLPQAPSLGIAQPQNLPAISPVLYQVNMSIDEVRLHNVPPSFKMIPGMPITADVKVGRRSVFEYFFERVLPKFSEGMREPS